MSPRFLKWVLDSTFNVQSYKNYFTNFQNAVNTVKVLIGKDIFGKQEAVDLLQKFQYYNDNERFPLALYGYTPQEVFEGAIPDRYRFSADIKTAEKSRYLRNKAGKFCDVCSDGKWGEFRCVYYCLKKC